MITKDDSIPCIAWVALRSTVKVEFEEISGGGETSGTGYSKGKGNGRVRAIERGEEGSSAEGWGVQRESRLS